MDVRAAPLVLGFPTARLFVTCWLIFAVHWAPFVIREQYPAITLATQGTLNVERFLGWNADIFSGPSGGAFINNNPGASIAGAVPLFLARPILSVVEAWNDTLPASIARSRDLSGYSARAVVKARREWYFLMVAFLTAAGLMAPVSALAVTALGGALWSGGVPRAAAIAVALVFGFGTPVFMRTGYLNHNLLAAHAGLLAVLILWHRPRQPVTPRRAAIAGALGGFALLCDYSGAIILATVGAYAWFRAGDGCTSGATRWRTPAWYVVGATPMLLGLALYQQWAFGHSALPSQHFMPAIEQTARGYRGIDWPSFELLVTNFFDPRFGLFAVCPVLLPGLAAPFIRSGRYRLPSREMWLILGYFAALAVFCSSNQYSRLQWTTGIRYLVPAIPGLLLLSAQVLQTLPSPARWFVLAGSIASAWLPAMLHAPVLASLGQPRELQLSWIRRMAEYDATAYPAWATVAVLLTAAGVTALIWRQEIARAAASVETARAE